jgi:hypothetical protein
MNRLRVSGNGRIELVLLVVLCSACRGQAAEDSPQEAASGHRPIDGAVIYDHDPATTLGDDVFGNAICDFEKDAPGRNSHGGPVCMEYPDGSIVAFHTNASDHNLDGWSEYAVSKDGGKTWEKYKRFDYSYEAYRKDQKRPAWVEEGLVTERGTVVLFVTHFENGRRVKSVFMRSRDSGSTWTDRGPVDGDYVGYPAAVAVSGSTSYVLFDSVAGPHVLYVSTDDGRTWRQRSTLTLDDSKWYGALCIMGDGRLLAGAYATDDEDHLYYCISEDEGRSWSGQERAHVDKKIRDPELAYIGGKYYLHGRSGHQGQGAHRFVLYQSDDGINWKSGVVVSGQQGGPDGYSHNCIINKYDPDTRNELMIEYSIQYSGGDTNEYVFFVRPQAR